MDAPAGGSADPALLREGPVVVVGMAPLWGMPSPSPFCTKLETWLRMAGIPYTAKVLQGPPRSATGKIPYLELPGGGTLPDSGRIIAALTVARGVRLDDHLSAHDRAVALAIRRMIEEHLYFALAWSRWEPGYALVRDGYFGAFPALIRPLVGAWLRRQIRGNLAGQGVGRLPPDQIRARAAEDLRALADLLGGRDWFFDQPSSTDAIAYAFLGGLRAFPGTEPIKDSLLSHPALLAHIDRVRARWWADAP